MKLFTRLTVKQRLLSGFGFTFLVVVGIGAMNHFMIRAMIANTTQSVAQGATLVDETRSSFTEIVTGTSRVATMVGEIAGSSREQAVGIKRSNQAMEEMNGVVQNAAATAEEAAATAEEFSAMAESMGEIMQELMALIGGNQGCSLSGKQLPSPDRQNPWPCR